MVGQVVPVSLRNLKLLDIIWRFWKNAHSVISYIVFCNNLVYVVNAAFICQLCVSGLLQLVWICSSELSVIIDTSAFLLLLFFLGLLRSGVSPPFVWDGSVAIVSQNRLGDKFRVFCQQFSGSRVNRPGHEHYCLRFSHLKQKTL